jgi:hypothetical protein
LRRSEIAAGKAQQRARQKIVDAIIESGGTAEQQSLALKSALVHPSLSNVVAPLHFASSSEENQVMTFQFDRIRDIMKVASATNHRNGQTNDDRAGFVETILTTVADDDGSNAGRVAPSIRSSSALLGLPRSTLHTRKLKDATKKRKALISASYTDTDNVQFSQRKKRKGHSEITPELRADVKDWIMAHDNIINSPIARDTLLVNGVRVGKLLREVSIRELHNHMVRPVNEGGLASARNSVGKIIVSDKSLRRILKSDLPQLKRATESHKMMCVCKICLTMASLQRSLNVWRTREAQSLVAGAKDDDDVTNGGNIYAIQQKAHNYDTYVKRMEETPRKAVLAGLCPEEKDCPGYHHWNCVLRRCKNCPEYKVVEHENQHHESATIIPFHTYLSVTRCSKHGVLASNSKACEQCTQLREGIKAGKVRTRKHLTKLERKIGVFLVEFYIPLLEKYAYHFA